MYYGEDVIPVGKPLHPQLAVDAFQQTDATYAKTLAYVE
jgi:hypothetical protein